MRPKETYRKEEYDAMYKKLAEEIMDLKAQIKDEQRKSCKINDILNHIRIFDGDKTPMRITRTIENIVERHMRELENIKRPYYRDIKECWNSGNQEIWFLATCAGVSRASVYRAFII